MGLYIYIYIYVVAMLMLYAVFVLVSHSDHAFSSSQRSVLGVTFFLLSTHTP